MDLGSPWYVEAKTVLNRGSAIFCAVEQLEAKGCSVEIVGRIISRGSGDNAKKIADIRIQLKRHGEYLDPNILAFWLAHPAAARRIGFKLKESLPAKWCEALSNNYGIVVAEEPRKEGETYYLTTPPNGEFGWAPYITKGGAEQEITKLLTTLNEG